MVRLVIWDAIVPIMTSPLWQPRCCRFGCWWIAVKDSARIVSRIVRSFWNGSGVWTVVLIRRLPNLWYGMMLSDMAIQTLSRLRNVTRLYDKTSGCILPDSKVHGANMGSTWVLSAPDGPHVGPMNLAIRAETNPIIFLAVLERGHRTGSSEVHRGMPGQPWPSLLAQGRSR